MAVVSLLLHADFSLAAASGGHSPVAVCRLLPALASLVGEHGLWGAQSVLAVACGLSGCDSRALQHRLSICGIGALLLHSMWDVARLGIKPVSPTLAGRFFTTEPPGKP